VGKGRAEAAALLGSVVQKGKEEKPQVEACAFAESDLEDWGERGMSRSLRWQDQIGEEKKEREGLYPNP